MTSRFVPHDIVLDARHAEDVPRQILIDAYVERASRCGLAVEQVRLGSHDGYAVVHVGGIEIAFMRGEGGEPSWKVEARGGQEAPWRHTIAELCCLLPDVSGFRYAVLRRQRSSWAEFVPQPPLARSFHVVTTTEREAAERYEDPAYFWSIWDRVERLGDARICIRALDDVEDHAWLDRTFEQTMELSRLARPGQTHYVSSPRWHDAFAPWWQYGDVRDDKAGFPALTYVGWEAATRTVEYAGFITRTLDHGGPDPRHVLVGEIHELRELIENQQDADGRAVDAVRVVFLEEWMARQERRPLLDAGAQVFYMDCISGALVTVTP